MKIYSLYDAQTGLFVGRTFGTDVTEDRGASSHAKAVELNTPDGHGMVEGEHDHLSKKVDLDKVAKDRQALLDAHSATVIKMQQNYKPAIEGEKFLEPAAPLFIATAEHVIDYQPAQPSEDHEWNADTKRWGLSAAAQAKAAAAAATKARIAQLRAQQHDLVPRAVLGDAAAKEQLQGLEDQVRQLQIL
jgi:hypothetical protein